MSKNINEILKKIENDEIINLIKTHSQGPEEIYLVGGIFRDYYLDKENFDKDLVVFNVSAETFARDLAKSIDATFVPLDEENKIYRLVLKDKINCIDIASPTGRTIEEDLKRRDLTINSVAINLKTLEITDVTGGIEDLNSKKIRHISEQNFIDDPLRMLRAYRFEGTLGFEIEEELTNIIKKHAPKIHQCSIERINYEFLKLLSGNFGAQTVLEMNETGMLQELFPIVEELKKIPPNLHHHLDLFHHSIEIIKQIQELYEKSSSPVQEHLNKTDFGGATRLAHLKLAGLLHDIGKPSTWSIEEGTGRHRFIKHDDIGSKMGAKLLKTAKFSKKQIEYVSKMIKYHIYPTHVVSAPDINDKIYMRFVRKMGNEAIDVIILAMADRLSARGVEITDEIVNKNLNNLQALLDFYLNIKDNLKPLPKLLSGEEIMELLNLKPSPELGKVIKSLNEAQLAGDVTSREDAIRFLTDKELIL